MAVPLEIRQVPRPKNTVVINSGKPGMYQYSVKARKKPVYRPGKTPSPRNGAVIGHIFEGQFVALKKNSTKPSPDFLSYGTSALLHSVSQDIFGDLTECFKLNEAALIMTIAMARVIRPKIPNSRIASLYRRTFISRYYPDMALSKNIISNFLDNLGSNISRQQEFFQKRLSRMGADRHIAIDGMLKQDCSVVNDLSAFSRKARVKGCKEISILYAYDIEKMEPLCSEVFPGNCIDAIAYRQFVVHNGITRGLIIADKGFPSERIAKELKDYGQLHFLNPIKRNSSKISTYRMTEYSGVLKGIGKEVYYSKHKEQSGLFLYAFRDVATAAKEDSCFAKNSKKHPQFDTQKYQQSRDRFGTIVFESDLDMPPLTVYQCYEDRWLLEIVFNRYKNYECLDQTRVQGDFSVYGNEFINFVATLLTMRVVRKVEKVGLLKTLSFYDIVDELSSAWRRAVEHDDPVANDDKWIHTNVGVMDMLVRLGLAKPDPHLLPMAKVSTTNTSEKKSDEKTVKASNSPKRGRGRPRIRPVIFGPPRPRGRPKKVI